ncbi:MAG: hypothetical protein TR69_WS6001001329 [candidate division WS6 bacterium OLB20]|uniref:SGNH/GDSL hydrolase family protein n=1 Tax=candidate division WS6 bacterium OLB20 TaxID=1617426 RepID=A0A136LWM8_9BACT|nr:MAG: hypothetical protein TR69_WS6001001329 [candidate division WS6 bacterium OLB20]
MTQSVFEKISIILVTLLALHMLVYGIFQGLAGRGDLYRLLDRVQSSAGVEVDYLMLGDSHGQQIKERFQSQDVRMMNLSVNGSNYVHHYYTLKKAYEEGIRAETVILPVDPNSFADYKVRFFANSDYFWINILDYDALQDEEIEGYNFERKYLQGRYLPYAFDSSTWLLFARNLFPHVAPDQDDSSPGFRNERQYYNNVLFKDYFYRTMDLARDNGSRIILVAFPASDDYFAAHAGLDGHYEQLWHDIRYGGYNPPLMDLRRLYKDDQGIFKDGHHVRNDQQQRITEDFTDALLRLDQNREAVRLSNLDD